MHAPLPNLWHSELFLVEELPRFVVVELQEYVVEGFLKYKKAGHCCESCACCIVSLMEFQSCLCNIKLELSCIVVAGGENCRSAEPYVSRKTCKQDEAERRIVAK